MRVENNPLDLIQRVGPNAVPRPLPPKSNQAGADKVNISDMAAQLSADPSKLAQLAAAVQSGTYNVSPNQVAASIINEMLAG